jgi:hypothetical protein
MGGYSAIATGAGTVQTLPDGRLCKPWSEAASTSLRVRSAILIYIGVIRD